MGIRDTLFAIITFVIMVYNGLIMESRFADVESLHPFVLRILIQLEVLHRNSFGWEPA